MEQQQYLNAHQTRDREPTDYENLLGDGIEKAYAAGIHDLPGICALLNTDCVPSPGGKPWTPELFQQEMQRLGA
ncbi:MAG: hypothetical protein JWO28_2832 [Hyphomicrobiales bacterium]|jgi:hypothetical protein|nr:hypothetical protein [Hyphomicrobiales bacterium]